MTMSVLLSAAAGDFCGVAGADDFCGCGAAGGIVGGFCGRGEGCRCECVLAGGCDDGGGPTEKAMGVA
jgi:hypothetical protein